MAEQQRLNDMPRDGLYNKKQGGRPQNHCPTNADSRRQNERKNRGYDCANVGHEAQDHRQHSPQRGAGNADEPQSRSYHEAEGGVERKLSEKQPTESLPSIV